MQIEVLPIRQELKIKSGVLFVLLKIRRSIQP